MGDEVGKPIEAPQELQPGPAEPAVVRDSLPSLRGVATPAQLLSLQRTAGNQATGRALAMSARRPMGRQVQPAAATPAPAAPTVDPARRFIADYARRVPGYPLLAHAAGADPITGEPVRGSLLREVAALIPGGAELLQRLEHSGAVDRATAWLSDEITKLQISYDRIATLFQRAWDSISAWDLFDPAAAWARLSAIFEPTLARIVAFAERAADKLLELSLEAMLAAGGGAAQQVIGFLRRAGQAFGAIVRDPIGFASNLVDAVKGGFAAFAGNLAEHLQRGLLGWLTGALGGLVRLPQRLDFEGIVSLVTQVLGLTWDRVRGRLVRMIGERQVAFLERAVDFVRDIAQRGLGAAWERIMEFASGLIDQVLGGIRDWLAESVIGAAIRRIATMFNPAGAVINAVLAIYNTIEFVVTRARQLGELIDAVAASISEIASGAIGRATHAVENALGRAVPVAIGFLAQLIGLGDVGERVQGIIGRVRNTVEHAIDRVIDWIVARFRGRGAEGQEAAEPQPPGAEAAEPPVEFDAAGEHHRLYVDASLSPPQVIVASEPTRLRNLIRDWRVRTERLPDGARPGAIADLDRAVALLDEEEGHRRGNARDGLTADIQQSGANRRLVQLRAVIERLFTTFARDTARDPFYEPRASFRCIANITLTPDSGTRVATGDMPRYRGRATGAAVADERDGRVEVETRTWATGNTAPGSANTSHGELHLANWLAAENQRTPGFYSRIVRLELDNDPYTPCGACTGELIDLIGRLPRGTPCSLNWTEPYYPAGGAAGPNATRAHHLNDLIAAGWIIRPGVAAFTRMVTEIENAPPPRRR